MTSLLVKYAGKVCKELSFLNLVILQEHIFLIHNNSASFEDVGSSLDGVNDAIRRISHITEGIAIDAVMYSFIMAFINVWCANYII